MTDSKGTVVNFKNTLIILTSNLGSEFFPASFEKKDEDKLKGQITEKTKEFFRPEFLNRLDDVIIFERLTRDSLGAIIDVQMVNLNARLREKNIYLTLTDAARTWFLENGFSSEYGARPLKRLMQSKIKDKLADGILSGNIKDGTSLQIDVIGSEMEISECSERKKMH